MANDLIVRILGDTKGLERSFAQANRATVQFGRQVDTTGAKIDATTKKFSGFARGAAAGFGGAFALSQGIQVIKQLATVAAESETVLGQTSVALESTGKSWAEYGKTIEDAVQAQSRLGFDDEALLRTFSLFIRSTDDVGEALKRNNLAMDIARARFISLEQAAQIVNKAALGQAGALRRLGIDTKGATTPLQLLTRLQEKYGGAAEAASDDASTSFARTQVAVENLQESVGRLLLPALEVLADNLQALAEFADNVTTALGKLGSVNIPEIELPFNVTIGGQSVGDLAGAAIGKAKFIGPFLPIAIANRIAQEFRDGAEQATPDLANSIHDAMEKMVSDAIAAAGTFGITKLPAGGILQLDPSVAATSREIVAAAQGNLEEVLEIQTRRRDSLRRQVENARKTWKDAEKLADLERRYAQAQAAVISTQKQIAAQEKQNKDAAQASAKAAKETAAANAEAARARAKQVAENKKALEQARQFRALGLDAAGGTPPPTIANLLKQVTQLSSRDLSSNQKGVLERIRKVLVDPMKKATSETRAAAKGLIDAIRDELNIDKKVTGPLTKTTGLNADKLLEGLGLGPDQIREARARLSGFNSAGRALAGNQAPTGQFRGGGAMTETTVTVNLDGETVARNTTRHQQKGARRNPKQKRGPRSGV